MAGERRSRGVVANTTTTATTCTGSSSSGNNSGGGSTIRFRTFLRNTVLDVMRSRGWIETDSETAWDYYWADVSWIRECYDHVRLDSTQHINHFRNHYELTRKDVMVKNFKRMRKAVEKQNSNNNNSSEGSEGGGAVASVGGGGVGDSVGWDFYPATFCLPQDYALFEQEFRRRPNTVWIMKPPAKAQGKGIFLFSRLAQVAEWRREFKQRQGTLTGSNSSSAAAAATVLSSASAAATSAGTTGASSSSSTTATAAATAATANAAAAATATSATTATTAAASVAAAASVYGSEAVEPYLAQRYIANPHLIGGKKYDLRLYIYVQSYSPLVVWLHRTGFARFCHHHYSLDDIDNTFIHVTNVAVQKTNPHYTAGVGCKFSLRSLRMLLTATHGPARAGKVFADIQLVILRTLLAVQRVILQDKHCSELYGYDVMLDDELHPWLLETNASPSLTAETPADYHLKFNVLEDMFNVLDLERRRSGSEVRVGGFDLIWHNGPVDPTATSLPSGGGSTAAAYSSSSSSAMMTDAQCTHSWLGCANEHEIAPSQMRLPPRLQQYAGAERLLT